MLRILLALSLLPLAVGARAVQVAELPDGLDAAARGAVGLLPQLAISPEQFGFSSYAEMPLATVGRPLPVRFAGLSALAAYQPGDDPEGGLTDTGAYVYPVSAAGRARCTIKMVLLHGAWQAAVFSRAPEGLSAVLDRTNEEAPYVLIEAPAVFVTLVEDPRSGMAASVRDDRRLGVAAGEFKPLAELRQALAGVARRTDPSRPDSAPRP